MITMEDSVMNSVWREDLEEMQLHARLTAASGVVLRASRRKCSLKCGYFVRHRAPGLKSAVVCGRGREASAVSATSIA